MKVSEANYVPRNVTLCSRLDPYMMTVDCRYGALTMLENDPRVLSVSMQEKLRMLD